MNSALAVLKVVCRAAFWRSTPNVRLVGLTGLLVCAAILIALRVALELAAVGTSGGFNPYGINAAVASIALEIAVAAAFIPPGARTTALSAMLILSGLAELASAAARLAVVEFAVAELIAARLPSLEAAGLVFHERTVPFAIFAVVSLWWIGAMVAVMKTFAPQPPFARVGRATALWAALLAVSALLPHAPIFVGRDFDIRSANLWETLRTQLATAEAKSGPTGFEQAQHALLAAEVAKLAPPQKGGTNIYALGIAGWAGQDVFLKELDGALAAMNAVLPIRGHWLRLVNHPETVENLPLANQRNFAAAVHALGQILDKESDVLLLLMTSHGQPSGFALRLPSEVVSELTPQEVATVLNREGIKNRIVIVSACFSGTFVAPLANDNTIVLTAADAKNTSFGCAPERDWTYFGDAFFRQSLRPGRDFQHAFDNARVLIEGWELMDGARPSNPQAHFGPVLVSKLAPLFEAQKNAGP
jgi:Peptidase C13 family